MWAPKLMIEKRYARSIIKITAQMEQIIKEYKEPADMVAAMKAYAASAAYQKAAEDIAMKMVTHLFEDGQKTWRRAARVNGMGREIYAALRQELIGPTGGRYHNLIRQNAQLIKTLPLDTAEHITKYVAKQQKRGLRAEEIAERIQLMFPEKTKANAELIARTEVSKASTALTQYRCEDMGIKWYIWRTSEDQRVRDSHDKMEGILIRWDDPPSPEALNNERNYGFYHAGNTFNCRCYPEPLIELHYTSWPHKVYYGGRIQMMTLAQFKQIA